MKKKLITLLVILIAPFSILATETNHLVISEFSFNGNRGIIEIYNPTSSDIDITAYRIERDSGGNGNPSDLILLNNSGKDGFIRTTNIIKSHGYFLIVDKTITALTNIGDFIKTNNISINADDSIALGTGPIDGPSDADCVDWIGYGSATWVEGNGPAPNPSYPGSIERKAWSGATSNSMTTGADTNHGNAEDSDNNDLDFIIRTSADWQNTSSPKEAPYSPAIEEISLVQRNLTNRIIRDGDTNLSLLAFNVSDNSNNRTLQSLHITNLGTMPQSNIISLKLYFDKDNSTNYSTGDEFVANLISSGQGLWTNNHISFSSNLNQPNGRNFVITATFAPSISKGKTVQLSIQPKNLSVSSGVSNNFSLTGNLWYAQPTLSVVINELAWSGTKASSADEWVEFFNNINTNIDFTGWTLKADDGVPSISLSGIISNKNFFLMEKTDDNTVSDIPADLFISFGAGFGNTGENVKLFDNNGNLVDYINCASGWYAGTSSPDYYSMERKYPNLEGVATNWGNNNGVTINGLDADLTNTINGTPRQPNSITPFYNFQVSFSNVPNATISFVNTNTPVLSFHYQELVSGLTLQKIKIQNNQTIINTEISNIKIYNENGSTIGQYDGTETFIDTLHWNGTDAWTNNHLSISNNSQILLVLNINHNAIDLHSFQCIVPANGLQASGVSPGNLPFTNAFAQTNQLPEIITLNLATNFATKNYFPGDTNVPVLSFIYKNNKSTSLLKKLCVTNLGDFTNISKLNLYTNSVLAGKLKKSNSKIYTNNNLSISPNSSLLITMDLSTNTNNYNQYFQAKINQGDAISINNVSNSAVLSNTGKQFIQVDHTSVTISNLSKQTNFPGEDSIKVAVFSVSNDITNRILSQVILSNTGSLPNTDITNLKIISTTTTNNMILSNNLWISHIPNTIIIGQTNKDFTILADIKVSASTNKTFIPVIPQKGIKSDKIGQAPSTSTICGTNFIKQKTDSLSFGGFPINSNLDVAIEQPVLSFHIKSDNSPIKLTQIILSNAGALPNSKIQKLTLYQKGDSNITQLTTNDINLGNFTYNNPNWQNLSLNIDISSNQTKTNFIVTLLTTMDFTNTYTLNFIIKSSNIISSGTGKAPSSDYSNSIILKITNSLPAKVTNFHCVLSNASSANLQWSPYNAPSDFKAFLISFGTNSNNLTNTYTITNRNSTNTTLSNLYAEKKYYVKIFTQDKANQINTNTTLLSFHTTKDTNAPIFNENSIQFSINKKVVKLWWNPAVDKENSLPIYYDILISDSSHTYTTNYSTTNTSYSLSFDAGTYSIKIQAKDSASTNNSTTPTREITITIKGVTSLDNVYFFPNPLKNDEHIHFNNFTDTAEIYIYTIQGHLLFKTTNTNFTMPSDVAAGVYYVVIKDGKQKKIKKLVYIK